nr:hypothetical protein [Tanacetum cinerariifolium]
AVAIAAGHEVLGVPVVKCPAVLKRGRGEGRNAVVAVVAVLPGAAPAKHVAGVVGIVGVAAEAIDVTTTCSARGVGRVYVVVVAVGIAVENEAHYFQPPDMDVGARDLKRAEAVRRRERSAGAADVGVHARVVEYRPLARISPIVDTPGRGRAAFT